MSTTTPATARVFSGVAPTGPMHLGNYLGAVRRWVAEQDRPGGAQGTYCVVDLHAYTVDTPPHVVRAYTAEQFALLLACGLDPRRSTVFVQSDVPAHAELCYLLECVATYGEARRMIQFREKATAAAGQASVRLSLLSYPVLMAGDILLHRTTEVPVGEDQSQHVELARDLAVRFNRRYGQTFVVPRLTLGASAARVMDLRDPHRKMNKSAPNRDGVVGLLDPPDTVRRKIARTVTDTGGEVRHDPAGKPGVSNLLDILAAITGGDPAGLAARFGSYRELKEAVADEVVGALAPVQARHRELTGDPAGLAKLADLRRHGAARARAQAAPTLARVRDLLF